MCITVKNSCQNYFSLSILSYKGLGPSISPLHSPSPSTTRQSYPVPAPSPATTPGQFNSMARLLFIFDLFLVGAYTSVTSILTRLHGGHFLFVEVLIPPPTISPQSSSVKKKATPPSSPLFSLPPPPPNEGMLVCTSCSPLCKSGCITFRFGD